MEVVLLHFPISALAWFKNVFIDVSSGPWQHTRVPLVFVLDAPSPDSVPWVGSVHVLPWDNKCYLHQIRCLCAFSCFAVGMLYCTVVLYKSPDRCSHVSYIRGRKKERTKESKRGYHAVRRNAINAKHSVIEHKVIMKVQRGYTQWGAWAWPSRAGYGINLIMCDLFCLVEPKEN